MTLPDETINDLNKRLVAKARNQFSLIRDDCKEGIKWAEDQGYDAVRLERILEAAMNWLSYRKDIIARAKIEFVAHRGTGLEMFEDE